MKTAYDQEIFFIFLIFLVSSRIQIQLASPQRTKYNSYEKSPNAHIMRWYSPKIARYASSTYLTARWSYYYVHEVIDWLLFFNDYSTFWPSQPAELSQEQNPSQWSTFSWKKCHKQLFFALIDLYELMEVASEPATASSMVQPQRSNPIMMPPT